MNRPDDIPSAVWPSECEKLAELARDGIVLEVGADQGLSTIVLAQAAKKVHTVDWFRGDDHAGRGDMLSTFWSNINRYNVRDKIIVHVGDSADVVPLFPRDTFDLAFIDAFHEEGAVWADAMRVWPTVKPGGWLAFHDYGRFTVAPAVDRLAEQHGTEVGVVDCLAFLKIVKAL